MRRGEQWRRAGARLLARVQHHHRLEWPIVVDANEEATLTCDAGDVLPPGISDVLAGSDLPQRKGRKRRNLDRLRASPRRRQLNRFESESVTLQCGAAVGEGVG